MRVIAIALQAGGVGKTTVSLNLGALLADRGRRVLLIDADAQCNLTETLNVTYDQNKSVYQVLVPEEPDADPQPVSEAIIATPVRDTLALVPGSPRMAYFDAQSASLDRREYRLSDSLKAINGSYDYVLIDCPPGLGFVLVNALFAAHEVLLPVQTRQRRVNALPIFIKRLAQVQKHHPVEVLGIVPNQYDRRNAHDQQAFEYIQKFAAKYGFHVFKPISTTTRISEADAHRKPLCDYDRNTPASDALEDLADQIDARPAAAANA